MPRKILNNLSVGQFVDARLFANQFDSIVSLSNPSKYTTGQFLIPDGEHRYNIFKRCVDYVIDKLKQGKKVLVHCQAGISRSVAVCTAVVGYLKDKSFENAYKKCKHNDFHASEELIKSSKRYLLENK